MSRFGPAGAPGSLRARTYRIIFGHDSRAGRRFDELLLVVILVSVGVVMLDSVAAIREEHGSLLLSLEWIFTLLFTVEYVARLWSVDRPRSYATSFFGVVDLLAVIPTYLSILVPGGQLLIVVRMLRVIRVFRILKLAQYVGEANLLGSALRASRYKIVVFLLGVVSVVVVVGALMYLVEGPDAGFTSIPRGVYWAIVTLTTVGYGDIHPVSPVGQALAALVMILGYGVIAVPTGIVTTELGRESARRDQEAVARPTPGGSAPAERADAAPAPGREEAPAEGRSSPRCGRGEPDAEARFCRYCGAPLPDA
jgi:voltage-gated potassium channel